MLELVPHTMIQENKDLKETMNVLHAVMYVYKQAEIDAEEDSENGEKEMTTWMKLPTKHFPM